MSHQRSIRHNLETRAKVIRAIRGFFEAQGFLEVTMPVRVPSPAPEEHIAPERSGDWFLAASPELQMKRLVAEGYERIFSMGPVFRAGEVGHLHNPEFTLLEWYRGGGAPEDLMVDCESLWTAVSEAVGLGDEFTYQGRVINGKGPWPRMSVREGFERFAGWNPEGHPDADKFYFDLVDKVEPQLPQDRPLFLTDYPAAFASLAQLSPTNPNVAQRFELYMGGIEIANAYGELTDAAEQRKRFEAERQRMSDEGKRVAPLDEKFLSALASMPATAGIALGVDRLVMLCCDAASIADVMPFPVSEL